MISNFFDKHSKPTPSPPLTHVVLNVWGRFAASVLWALLLNRRLIGTSCFYASGRQRTSNLFVLRLATKCIVPNIEFKLTLVSFLKLLQQCLDGNVCTYKRYKHCKYVTLCICSVRKVSICVILTRIIISNKAKVRAVKETITQGCSVFV